MIVRNLQTGELLINGIKVVLTNITKYILTGRIVGGDNHNKIVCIPRISIRSSALPYRFKRTQFPIMVSYAMTIHKSQGQSLTHVGIYMEKDVFTHGQLYVALSRARDPKHLWICINHGEYLGDGYIFTRNLYVWRLRSFKPIILRSKFEHKFFILFRDFLKEMVCVMITQPVYFVEGDMVDVYIFIINNYCISLPFIFQIIEHTSPLPG